MLLSCWQLYDDMPFVTCFVMQLVRLGFVTTLLASVSHQFEQRSQLTLPNGKKLKVCNNYIVDNIPGRNETVLAYGKLYLEFMHNKTVKPLERFQDKWKYEVDRVSGPMLLGCTNLTVFGNEKQNYDEAKRFCFPPEANTNSCVAYSIGSNNKWGFEEYMFQMSNCRIETFDCTVDGKVPEAIKNRTHFHKLCMGKVSETTAMGKFISFGEIKKLLETQLSVSMPPPDFFKVDAEGAEWSIFKSIIADAAKSHKLEVQLPRQIYGEVRKSNISTPSLMPPIVTP